MKTSLRVLALAGLLLAAGALVGTTGTARTHAAVPDTATVTAAFKQAWLAVDLDALTAQMDDNVSVVEPSLGLNMHSKLEFRGFLEGFLQQNPGFGISFSESAYVLDTSVQRAFYTSDAIRATGAARIVELNTLVIVNGKIVSITGQLDATDADTATFIAALAG